MFPQQAEVQKQKEQQVNYSDMNLYEFGSLLKIYIGFSQC